MNLGIETGCHAVVVAAAAAAAVVVVGEGG